MDKVIAVEVNPVQLRVEVQPLQREARELAGPPEVLLVAHQLAARPDVEVEGSELVSPFATDVKRFEGVLRTFKPQCCLYSPCGIRPNRAKIIPKLVY